MKKIYLYSLFVFIIDRIIKVLVINFLSLNNYYKIIDNFFNLTFVKNTGAAFSILSNNVIFLVIFSICALYFINKYLIRDKKITNIGTIIYGLLVGGLIGNLFDRLIYGYVIDYLSFKLFNYYMPIFNLSDICIFISAISLIFLKEGKINEKNI